eukprot:TRINITY_DN1221_c0_g1_i2.p1 TRINITY_DN1221_c0_g1~~TRINITY_DN1221_c0_g1_i2.p1  ORF type:complete len:303 (+),score=79.65 TRINITY_DN1221_c0_g1_i2:261-1169(+)
MRWFIFGGANEEQISIRLVSPSNVESTIAIFHPEESRSKFAGECFDLVLPESGDYSLIWESASNSISSQEVIPMVVKVKESAQKRQSTLCNNIPEFVAQCNSTCFPYPIAACSCKDNNPQVSCKTPIRSTGLSQSSKIIIGVLCSIIPCYIILAIVGFFLYRYKKDDIKDFVYDKKSAISQKFQGSSSPSSTSQPTHTVEIKPGQGPTTSTNSTSANYDPEAHLYPKPPTSPKPNQTPIKPTPPPKPSKPPGSPAPSEKKGPVPPPGAPPPSQTWEAHFTDDGKRYYYNASTGESRWTKEGI